MPELICHLLGDYVLQNHAMAMRKTSSWAWAALHVALYMLPFLVLTRAPAALAVMAGTHLVIDRFRLAKYWVAFWGVGREGAVVSAIQEWQKRRHVIATYRADGWTIRSWRDLTDIGEGWRKEAAAFDAANPPIPPAPDFLAVWLLIIVDNTAHLAINHLSLVYLT
jgi:hypothetical protein